MKRVDLNIDKEGIPAEHFIDKSKQLEGGGYGEISPAQFATNLILSAVASAHPKGNMQTLRRTLKLKDALEKSSANGGVVDLEDDDLKYLSSSFAKATDWNNNPSTALVIDRVYKTLELAKEV